MLFNNLKSTIAERVLELERYISADMSDDLVAERPNHRADILIA